MIRRFRRSATAFAALAVIGAAGTGIAGAATPEATAPAHTALSSDVRTSFDPFCQWDRGFDWHYYRFCDDFFWHGSHHNDWLSWDRDHRGYDYGWRR
ncbi:hypothetical protein [Nocardia sp. NPDC046763]|uniref:hypothetical protein n=1 Tax=Nocardia sp. NPDC046763 TaxID=3155256 RepID=UPI0033ED1D7F